MSELVQVAALIAILVLVHEADVNCHISVMYSKPTKVDINPLDLGVRNIVSSSALSEIGFGAMEY